MVVVVVLLLLVVVVVVVSRVARVRLVERPELLREALDRWRRTLRDHRWPCSFFLLGEADPEWLYSPLLCFVLELVEYRFRE